LILAAALSQTSMGSLRRSSRPFSWFYGSYFWAVKGEGKGEKGKNGRVKRRKKENEEKRRKREKEGKPPIHILAMPLADNIKMH